ncbi:MAG TPA: type II secretion system protein [Burkholderiales bacterium]|nr:type II secretion system protein [Burkholderiales bacterium]
MTGPGARKKGFTLVEMVVTLTILSILAWSALPLTKIVVQREREVELRQDLRLMREAIDAYKKLSDEKKIEVKEDTEGYPPTLEILVKGVEVQGAQEPSGGSSDKSKGNKKIVKFLRRIPVDPMTGTTDWGLRSYQDSYDSDKWGEENVYDVYTKSQAKALDGTRYRDW